MRQDTINAWLRRERKAAGLNQEAVAAALGVVQKTVSNWENGLSVTLTRAQIQAFAQLVGVDPCEGLRLAGYEPEVLEDEMSEDMAALCRKFARLPAGMREAIRSMIEEASAVAA